jgi:hypothetical protein
VSEDGEENVTLVSPLHPEKHELPIELTDAGILIETSIVQPENVEELSVVIAEGSANVKLVNPLQF